MSQPNSFDFTICSINAADMMAPEFTNGLWGLSDLYEKCNENFFQEKWFQSGLEINNVINLGDQEQFR